MTLVGSMIGPIILDALTRWHCLRQTRSGNTAGSSRSSRCGDSDPCGIEQLLGNPGSVAELKFAGDAERTGCDGWSRCRA